MRYSKEAIQRIAYGELTPNQIENAVAAIDEFAKMFGAEWVDDYFRWNESKRNVEGLVSDAWFEEHFRVGSLPILHLVATWEDWCLIRGRPGADKIEDRWKKGFAKEGILSEIYVAAQLFQVGAEIELEPPSDAGKVADCRFRSSDCDDWIYVEVSRRGTPHDTSVNLRADKIRKDAAKAASRVASGLLGTVVILREPNGEEEQKILSWLDTIRGPAEQKLCDLAVFFAGLPGQGIPGDLDRVAKWMPGVKPFSSHVDDSGLGIAWLNLRDNMHSKILKDELDQLPSDKPAIVIIDTSNVIGFKWLPALADEVFGDEKASRLSALAFFRFLLAGEGTRTEGQIHFNPRASMPLSTRATDMLREAFPESSKGRIT